ncbi:hypothetical protein PW52_08275 [Tamlana sedimentorum]|uniref:Peptidase S1 domain-containing protein n=1 Tax=Neotamlana sedimentorum TaxID=1435349 RepID=A0A0D7WAN0_9FLAO|nr:serine protease [Tamlana sedimentorum]KJD35728.1 hypothetical protein PW52_08275 [Tamlana sedimentorum]
MENLNYESKEFIDKEIEKLHKSILHDYPNSVYIASIPKDTKKLDNNLYYIEIGIKPGSNDIPIICKDLKCNSMQLYSKTKLNYTELNYKTKLPKYSKFKFVPELVLQSHKKKERPLKHGINIGNKYLAPGTLGAIVQAKIYNEIKKYIISNHHVLSGHNFILDRKIYQPHQNYAENGICEKDQIALVKFGHFDDDLDVCFAELTTDDHISTTYIDNEGVPIDIETHEMIKEGEKVYIVGATSGKKTGILRSLNAYFQSRISDTSNEVKVLKNQLLLENISAPGDSGSLVVKCSNRKAIGLLMGGAVGYYSIANQMKFIFNNESRYENLPPIEFVKFV